MFKSVWISCKGEVVLCEGEVRGGEGREGEVRGGEEREGEREEGEWLGDPLVTNEAKP